MTTWSEEDDRKLWSLRSQPAAGLASTFGKTAGAVRSRIKHLNDPSHKAYNRRMNGAPRGASMPSSSGSSRSHGMSPFAASYIAAKSGGKAKSNNVIDLTAGTSPFAAAKASASKPSPSVLLSSSSHQQKQQQPRIDQSTLNADQKSASEYIFSGGNAFLTGAAGVGKSYLLNYLIQGLRDKYERVVGGGGGKAIVQKQNDQVVVAAATGIAATHIGGVTIHSASI